MLVETRRLAGTPERWASRRISSARSIKLPSGRSDSIESLKLSKSLQLESGRELRTGNPKIVSSQHVPFAPLSLPKAATLRVSLEASQR